MRHHSGRTVAAFCLVALSVLFHRDLAAQVATSIAELGDVA